MSRNHEHQSNLMQQLGAKNEVLTHKRQNSSNDLTASNNFYDNCRNSRGLIGYFLLSICGQTHELKIHATRQRARASDSTICYRKKPIDVSFLT